MRREVHEGFTLIELTFAIAAVSTLAAVLVPALVRTRKSANEASASAALKGLVAAQAEYYNATGAYADSLATLHAAGYIDDALGTGVKSGYVFALDAGLSFDAWTGSARPKVPQRTGDRSFYVDETGILRSICSPGRHVVIDPVKLEPACVPDDRAIDCD